MALLLFAADMLVLEYLNGRSLPSVLLCRIVTAVEARLLDGVNPVLDEAICTDIDENTTPPTAWSPESVVRAARAREGVSGTPIARRRSSTRGRAAATLYLVGLEEPAPTLIRSCWSLLLFEGPGRIGYAHGTPCRTE